MTEKWRWCWFCGVRKHFEKVDGKWRCEYCKNFEKEKEKKVKKDG
jgi:hypothetical protein